MDPAITRGIDGLIALTPIELAALLLLALSLAVNGVQLYRARVWRIAIYHGLVGLFNSIGWLQVREVEMLRQLRGRMHASSAGDVKLVLQEFVGHVQHSHYTLRLLHEELVATAKFVNDADPRWAGDRFGYADDQLEAFLGRSHAW